MAPLEKESGRIVVLPGKDSQSNTPRLTERQRQPGPQQLLGPRLPTAGVHKHAELYGAKNKAVRRLEMKVGPLCSDVLWLAPRSSEVRRRMIADSFIANRQLATNEHSTLSCQLTEAGRDI